MELADRVVTITGAASGIGRAMAIRFAREGAAGVVVADLDGERATAVAGELEAPALGLRCDVANPDDVRALIERTESAFGPVDLFCANAGIGGGAGLDTTDEEWDQAFDVNVRAHVTAARLLVPGWVERGEGYFFSTASAAGLLTVIGSAPYAVTKHAAVAFAEWLSITYGDRGVRVSCLCPMGVQTPLLEQGLAHPGEPGLGLRIVAASGRVLDPAEVAESALAAIREERFLVLPHPEVQRMFAGRAADTEAWLEAMRHVRASAAAASKV
jgi:NAD(P)-dependent dehydrogenase (short-subunit alcohol dehydrogenase family)